MTLDITQVYNQIEAMVGDLKSNQAACVQRYGFCDQHLISLVTQYKILQ
jgi:hypothetical protein